MNLENKVSKPGFFKRIARKALPLIFASGLAFGALMSCRVTPTPTPDYTAEKEVIEKAADRLVALQDAGGSWDWVVTNKTASAGENNDNLPGVTGEGLLDAYKVTGDVKYLDAAKKAGDFIVILPLSTNQRHVAHNIVFLNHLKDVTGDVAYKNKADAILNHLLHEDNYWSTHNGNHANDDGNPGCTATELRDAYKNYRSWAGDPNGVVPWDLFHFIEAAKSAGEKAFANDMASVIKNYLDQASYDDTVDGYDLGLAAGVMGLKRAGLDYSSPLTKLLAEQESDGHFEHSEYPNEHIQPTAYALMALDVAGKSAETKKASDYLVNNFGYGTTPHFDGWLEDVVEYAEVDSEAAQAIADYIE